MKYINADKLIAEIERLRHEWPKTWTEDDKNHLHYYFNALNKMLRFVESMEQEQPAPPGIEEEEKKHGWLDYGLTIGEIGLHRYNAIQRIREHKEKFSPQDIPSGILYDVAEYYESVGVEIAMCCLQTYCCDFRFTQEDVKEIIRKEG